MTLPELQDKLYDVLCMVDDICKKEGIRWFLDGGTEIGSVREKDIIPWDDDIDAKILREDYPKFKAAMLKYLPENYRYIEPEEFSPYFFDDLQGFGVLPHEHSRVHPTFGIHP